MFALKLFLVPAFLLLVSVAAKRWGPSTAGWLAGLPLVAGPTLFFIAVEQGVSFGAQASTAALLAVSAVASFSLAYAHTAQRLRWPLALCAALFAWGAATFSLAALPVSIWLALPVSLATLCVAPRMFPMVPVQDVAHRASGTELGCRMLAGAVATVTVTWLAGAVGEMWSGLFAVFPTLGTVLAVFSHRAHGGAYVAALFRAMLTGLYSFAAFCFALSVALPPLGIAGAFVVAIAVSLGVQLASRKYLRSATVAGAVA